MPLGLGPFLDNTVTVLLLIAVAFVAVNLYKKHEAASRLLQRQAAPDTTSKRAGLSAEDILNERYARGGIDRAHYLDTLQNLKARSGFAPKESTRPLAEDIVRERYARGEINASEFQQTMDDLKSNRG